MSSIAYYTFYLESEQGIPAGEEIIPAISSIKKIPGGELIDFSSIQESLTSLGDGLFQYEIDWDDYENDASLFVIINTGLDSQDQKFLTTRLERHDILPALVDKVQLAAETLQNSSNSLESSVQKILDIEEGSWVIEGSVFKIFEKTADVNTADPILEFDLYDAQGELNGENPTKRIVR
jgi:CRISPR/Cas system-associated endonuclease/helicase Cas3